MKPKELIIAIHKDERKDALKFLLETPPHPDELGALEESKTFMTSKESHHDMIRLERLRAVGDNEVTQESAAVGLTITDEEEIIPTLLGCWTYWELKDKLEKPRTKDDPELEM